MEVLQTNKMIRIESNLEIKTFHHTLLASQRLNIVKKIKAKIPEVNKSHLIILFFIKRKNYAKLYVLVLEYVIML